MTNSTKQIQLILKANDIDKAITSFKHSAHSLQADLHRIASSALSHYFKHGNNTLCTKLIKAMPKSQRTNKLTHWFCVNGGLEFNNESGKFEKRNDYDELQRELKLQAAIATPFWKMKDKISEDVDYNFDNINKSIVAFLKAKQALAKQHGDVLDITELLKAVV